MTPDCTVFHIRSSGYGRSGIVWSSRKGLDTGRHENAAVRCPCSWLTTLRGAPRTRLLMSLCTRVSRNAMWLLSSTCMVKRMVCCCVFKYIGKLWSLDPAVTMKVSSTHPFQIREKYYAEQDLRACSKYSMHRLTLTAQTELPMAAPSSYSYKFPLYVE